MSNLLLCDGNITVNQGSPVCSSGWTVVNYVAPFDGSQVTPENAFTFFAAGFFVFIPVLLASLAGSHLVKKIRKG